MGAAWLTLRADLRRRWRPMLGMVLLIGLVSGVVLVAAAGARRTSTAYPRFLSRSHAADLLVSPTQSGFRGYFRAVAGLPAGGCGRHGGVPADVLARTRCVPLLGAGGRGEPFWWRGRDHEPGQGPGRPHLRPGRPACGHDQPGASRPGASPARRDAPPDRVPAAPRRPRPAARGPAGFPGVGHHGDRRRDRARHPRAGRAAGAAESGVLPYPPGPVLQPGWWRQLRRPQAWCGRFRIHQPGRRPGRAVPRAGSPDRPPGHRIYGRPAGHSAGSGSPRDLRRDGRPDRAGCHWAAAEPPARPRLDGIPDPARPRHDRAPSRGAIPGQGGPGDRGWRCGCCRSGRSRVSADAHRSSPVRRAQPRNRRQPDDSGHRIPGHCHRAAPGADTRGGAGRGPGPGRAGAGRAGRHPCGPPGWPRRWGWPARCRAAWECGWP